MSQIYVCPECEGVDELAFIESLYQLSYFNATTEGSEHTWMGDSYGYEITGITCGSCGWETSEIDYTKALSLQEDRPELADLERTPKLKEIERILGESLSD